MRNSEDTKNYTITVLIRGSNKPPEGRKRVNTFRSITVLDSTVNEVWEVVMKALLEEQRRREDAARVKPLAETAPL